MDVTIDQARQEGEPPSIDAGRTTWNSNRATGTGCINLCIAHDHCGRFDQASGPVDEPDMMYCEDHDLQLPMGNVMMMPPITSLSLKSLRGLFGCRLWQSTHAWETARSAKTAWNRRTSPRRTMP